MMMMMMIQQQESLANAKVSARHPWYIGHNSLNYYTPSAGTPSNINVIVEKYFQCATIIIPSLTMRIYLHSFSRCCLPNMRSSAKFRENWNTLGMVLVVVFLGVNILDLFPPVCDKGKQRWWSEVNCCCRLLHGEDDFYGASA